MKGESIKGQMPLVKLDFIQLLFKVIIHSLSLKATNQQSEIKPAQRVSSRIMSMKRRGKLERYKSIKFVYVANDYLAIRSQGYDFYLCRVLEDVPENKESFQIAWLDQVGQKKKVFKVCADFIVP